MDALLQRSITPVSACLRIAWLDCQLTRRTATTDVSAAFAASFLIRIARLFPHELNLRKTAKDVEELASVLEQGES